MQEQISTNLMINRIFAKIQIMEANSKNKDQINDTSICIDSQFLSYFPLKNAEELFLV
jgi:flagellar basal body-associated protein FliL